MLIGLSVVGSTDDSDLIVFKGLFSILANSSFSSDFVDWGLFRSQLFHKSILESLDCVFDQL